MLFSAGSELPLNRLFKASHVNILLPYHHTVSNNYLPHVKSLYNYKNTSQFEKDIDWLLLNFNAVHPHQVFEFVFQDKPIPKKSFLLSFDDGFREVHDEIAPLLYKKGVPALFFINPAFIDNKELFYRCKLSLVIEKIKSNKNLLSKLSHHLQMHSNDWTTVRNKILQIHYPEKNKADELGGIAEIDFQDFLNTQQPFLTTQQIASLIKQGFVFGAHSMDHPHYKFLNDEEQFNQTIDSLNYTNSIQQQGFEYFAFPHQDNIVKQNVIDKIKANQKNLLMFGLQNLKEEKHNQLLHRFNAEDPAQNFAALTKGMLFYNALLHQINKRKIARS